jgi:hypothetical protein
MGIITNRRDELGAWLNARFEPSTATKISARDLFKNWMEWTSGEEDIDTQNLLTRALKRIEENEEARIKSQQTPTGLAFYGLRFKGERDLLKDFLNSRFKPCHNGGYVLAVDLYNEAKLWAKKNNVNPSWARSKRAIVSELIGRSDLRLSRRKSGWSGVVGIRYKFNLQDQHAIKQPSS